LAGKQPFAVPLHDEQFARRVDDCRGLEHLEVILSDSKFRTQPIDTLPEVMAGRVRKREPEAFFGDPRDFHIDGRCSARLDKRWVQHGHLDLGARAQAHRVEVHENAALGDVAGNAADLTDARMADFNLEWQLDSRELASVHIAVLHYYARDPM